jgi:hypothetical protein
MATSNVKGGTGFRALTRVQDPSTHNEVLLLTQEATPFLVLKVDPARPQDFKIDLNASQFLAQKWKTPVGYGIAGYNNMMPYPEGSANPDLLIGFEAILSNKPADRFFKFAPKAHFFVRHPDGTYEVRTIGDPSISPQPELHSARCLIPSPFEGDPQGTLYACGTDANGPVVKPVHNTAWIYRGVPRR